MAAAEIVIATAVTTDVGPRASPRDLCAQIRSELGGAHADLCLLFGSAHFEDELDSFAAAVQEQLSPRGFIGASAEGVIAADCEYERQPALVLCAASRTPLTCWRFSTGSKRPIPAGRLSAAWLPRGKRRARIGWSSPALRNVV